MSKTKNKIRISFIGQNSESVTGSMTLVEFNKRKFLIEAGLFQSNSVLNDYKINNRRFDFKPKEIEYVFLGHCHADHMLLLPRLVAEGFTGKIIAPIGSSKLFSIMSVDCAYIMSKDVETLQRKYKMTVLPIYTESDAMDTLQYFEEYEFNEKFELDDDITFRFIPSGHIILSSQIEFWIKNGNHTSKILYTSDLGNISCEKYYVNKFEPVDKANLVIGESTYSDKVRQTNSKDRIKDLEKIKSIIDETCGEQKRKVLIAIFSLDRCQNIMTHIYDLYHEDKNFKLKILIDSPLAIKMCKLYTELLEGEQLDKWNKVMNWNNFVFINEYTDSKIWMTGKEPCCALSASGFMQAGRSRQWAKTLLPDSKSHIIFVGFSSTSSLAGKIKNGNKHKTITIDGKPIPNRCNITDLKSFSGHMGRTGLLDYYSNIDCEKVALVHGEFSSKVEFSKDLQEEISKKNRTSKVICVNSSTEILL